MKLIFIIMALGLFSCSNEPDPPENNAYEIEAIDTSTYNGHTWILMTCNLPYSRTIIHSPDCSCFKKQ